MKILQGGWPLKRFLADTFWFCVGCILFGIGILTFARGASFAPGGVSGLALIVNHFTQLPVGMISLVINIPLILISVKVVGLLFLAKTLWTMAISTFFLDMVLPLIPPYEGNPLLAALFTGVFMGTGIALIYQRGSSTGGSDFLTMTIKKLRPHWSIGRITLVLDAIVILAGGIAFKNVDAVLYGIVASYVTSIMIDNILYGTKTSKLAIIITNHADAIAEAISTDVDRGSTKIMATGTYTGEAREMLLCACAKREIYAVRAAAISADPECLLMVSEVGEVIGEGFIPHDEGKG